MLSDSKICELIDDPKPISHAVIDEVLNGKSFKNNPNSVQKVWSHTLQSKSGRKYVLIVRINNKYEKNFSVILCYIDENGNKYNLRRHNGLHGPHRNTIEKNKVTGFHIHKATERYQAVKKKIDSYAEETRDYTDWKGALDKMLEECNFKRDIRPLSYYFEVS